MEKEKDKKMRERGGWRKVKKIETEKHIEKWKWIRDKIDR